jgi:nitrogenase molybdenum-iron protein alpha chain
VKADFIIIRHNGLAPNAARMGIPSFAIGDEHFPVGYDGMIRVGEAVLEVLARKKMNQVLKRHVKLPYSDWWLGQKDPFILAKHPEVLDEDTNKEVQD